MKLSQTITCALAAAALCAFLPHGAVAEEASEKAAQPAAADPELTEELAFIKALLDEDMPDLAEPVIAAAKKKWPNAGPKLKVLELQGKLAAGQFDEVKKVVDSLKGKKGQEGEYWALNLSMANEYYARSMMPQCRQIYEGFFKTVTNPGADLLDFYLDSGFNWAQICVREKKFDEAVDMFDKLLSKPLPDERWCAVALEEVELLLRLAEDIPADTKDKQAKAKRKKYVDTATLRVDKLLWQRELILVFGKAIAMKAHIEMLNGNPDKAQTLVNDYMEELSEIHRNLVEQDPDGRQGYVRASPMPECRYLLAKMLWDAAQAEAKKPKPDRNDDFIKNALFGKREGKKRNGLGAYNHAINVYAKYADSSWAADAAEMTKAIEAFVKKEYNKEIKTNITSAQIEKLRKKEYQNAFEQYRSGEFENAAKAYQDLLGHVKAETTDSVYARGVLAECYVELRQNAKADKKEEYAKKAVEAENYVATQYKDQTDALVYEAGNATLRLAAKEKDLRNRDRAQFLYDAYFTNYPKHGDAPQQAYSLASQAYGAEDWATAIRYYTLIATQYTNSTHLVDALNRLAACYEKTDNVAEQEKWLRAFANATKKKDESLSIFLKLAVMQQKRAFEGYELADKTTNAVEAAKIQEAAFKTVLGAMRDFQAVSKGVANVLESSEAKSLDEKSRAQYQLRREQALFFLGNCLQRVPVKDPKMLSRLRKNAVASYEEYLKSYPKGQFGAQALMRIGTIHTAEKNMEKAQDAFARLQRDFPESNEAKNSVPQLAKSLIEMGMESEGVAQYKKMLETPGGKYTAGQFLLAGEALLGAKSWMVAEDAYAKVIELATPLTNSAYFLPRALMGQAKAARGAKNYAEARQKLDEFVEKYGKTTLVIEAYDMLVEVASIEGSREKDDTLRMNAFNAAVRALKKLRNYKKDPIEQYELDIRSGEVLLRKMEAESAMNLTDAAKETRGRAIVAFQAYLMAHEPENKEAFEKLTAKEKELLKRCYEDILPIMAVHGSQKEDIEAYEKNYGAFFPKSQGQEGRVN